MRRKTVPGLLTMLACCSSIQACEPIIPFMQVLGGPAILTSSLVVLVVAVALKAIAFAAWQDRVRFGHAIVLMIAGNLVTTIIGVVAALMMGSGILMLAGIGVA